MPRLTQFALALVAMSAGMTPAFGGTFSVSTFTGDADSGISSSKTYTHAIDLNGSGDGYSSLVVNGVTFTSGASGNQAALHYDLEPVGTLTPFAIGTYGTNFDPGLSGNIDKLLRNFYFNAGGAQTETLELSGLSPNTTYIASFYGAAFGDVGGRYDDVTDSQGGHILYDENQTGGTNNGSILRNVYTTGPAQTTMTFTWTINTTDGAGNITTTGDSYHQYGFTNELAVPEPASLLLLSVGALGLLGRRRKSR